MLTCTLILLNGETRGCLKFGGEITFHFAFGDAETRRRWFTQIPLSVTAVLLLEMPKQEDDLGVSDLRIGAGSGIGER